MINIGMVMTGIALTILADRTVRYFHHREETKSRNAADVTIKAHGLKAYLYLPTIGVEDLELRDALCRIPSRYIVVDATGQVVGKLATENVAPA